MSNNGKNFRKAPADELSKILYDKRDMDYMVKKQKKYTEELKKSILLMWEHLVDAWDKYEAIPKQL